MKKILIAIVAAMTIVATTLVTSNPADARWVGVWARRHWEFLSISPWEAPSTT